MMFNNHPYYFYKKIAYNVAATIQAVKLLLKVKYNKARLSNQDNKN